MRLTKPITAHGEELSELTLREPTTKDIIELGQPILLIVSDGGTTGIEVRQQVVARYISRLAAIPMSSVEKMDVKDFTAAGTEIMGFFGTGDAEPMPS